jgi:para-aminobenzoate synthetase component 1
MRQASVRPISRQRLPVWLDPEAAYSALYRDATDSFWLDSSDGSGRSHIGAGRRVVPEAGGGAALLSALGAELAACRTEAGDRHGFSLGLVGWFAYELGEWTVAHPGRETGAPPVASPGAFLRADRAIEFDPAARSVTLLTVGDRDPGADRWREDVEAALTRAAQGMAEPAPVAPRTAAAIWRDTDDRYLAMIEACKRAIDRGDAYQLCLTTSAQVPTSEHPLDVYRRLRATSPTHHGGLLRIGGTALLSASPEQFLSISPHGTVSTSPIKGTRPRGSAPAEDARLRHELEASEKERAENLMIVDLMRNDLARVCELGSVEVTRLLQVESYPQVHQLVSTVRGRLASGVTALDALRACFPAGSMTGAPKASAMRLVAQLEGAPRGVYSGVFGYLGFDGSADLAMVIRSIVLDASGATVGAGGGITALSEPAEELAEVQLKAAALLAALGAV